MSDALLRAYAETRYVVLDAIGIAVAAAMIGEVSATVDDLLAGHGAATGVFITAHNPRSEPTDAAANDAAHDRMHAALTARGVVTLPHIGIGADPAWAPEHGFLALDLPEDEALALAIAYEQNAVVVVAVGEPARLVVTSVMGT